ncbi:integrase catalytic domain-containing protein [Trichonephila clavipes]|nr:integrase catalytic domain-containing protein [Trichonephila clavipes]
MKDPFELKHLTDIVNNSYDEDEIENEKSKSPPSYTLTNSEICKNNNWYYNKFYRYESIVRLVAWIFRFKHNCVRPKEKRYGELVASEFQEAEEKLISLIQNESFSSESDDRLKALQAFRAEKGIFRLKTKITNRKDDTFLKPAILPPNHKVIKSLIVYTHEKICHAGVQILLNILREKYWILHGIRTVKRVLTSCITCKSFSSRNMETIALPLPEDRVKDAAGFQNSGI